MNLLGDVRGVSILKDPFTSSNIERVMVIAWRASEGFKFYSTVTFKNGNTQGEQRIDADSFDELLTKTKAFIETLKSKL